MPRTELTSQERLIIKLLCRGMTTKEVGAKLGISHKTVETHRANAYRILGIKGTAAMVKYAVREGLIKL